jgi:hypothetical protein
MSHRLEENEETKYTDHKEPKTPRSYSTVKPDVEDKEDSVSQRQSEGNIQAQSPRLSGTQQRKAIATLLLQATKVPLQTWIRA